MTTGERKPVSLSKGGRPKGSGKPLAVRFWLHVERGAADACWLWRGTRNGSGYGMISLNGGRRATNAQRASWILHHGEIPDGLHVLHRCDNPRCVNPAHLFLGTHAENMADRTRKGRGRVPEPKRGETNPGAKLTAADVERIRSLAGIRSQRWMARYFGVSHGTIAHIIGGQKWRNHGAT